MVWVQHHNLDIGTLENGTAMTQNASNSGSAHPQVSHLQIQQTNSKTRGCISIAGGVASGRVPASAHPCTSSLAQRQSAGEVEVVPATVTHFCGNSGVHFRF